ncbi:MAG: hypothetical protein BIFFINMI_03307 [Phycisphaerae bacterium]|nr:hypothetical protein [Phycisphaerae bacterium]
MKTTQIQIEGNNGNQAIVFRSSDQIVINLSIVKHGRFGIRRHEDTWVVSARSEWEQIDAARKLQRTLDGQIGTAGDVADYQRVIETFAD